MSVIEEIEWEECLVQPSRDPELERALRKHFGFVPPGSGYFMRVPWMLRSILSSNPHSGNLAHIDPDLAERISLVVSQEGSCRYCFATTRLMLRLQGMREARIRALEQELLTADVDPRERAALEFARRFSHANPRPGPSDLEVLRQAGYSDGAIGEIAVMAGLTVSANRACTLVAVPPHFLEALPDRWFMRLLRPLAGLVVGRKVPLAAPEFLDPTLAAGPFSEVVHALDGLPLARGLRQTLDEALAPSVLPRRTKLLVMAVIARGLDCDLSESECQRLLAEEGLGKDDLEPVLSHLGSARLDPVESVVVPFARETIRYRPAPLQRRARAVRERIGDDAFMDFVGVASLANHICRLGVLARRH